MKSALILEDMPESQLLLMEVAAGAFPDIQFHCAAGVQEALELLLSITTLDLGLIDLALPYGDGTLIIKAISERFPACTIVVTSLFDDDNHLFPALRAGAHGYLLKEQPQDVLVKQLQGIHLGQPPLSPAVARRLLSHFKNGAVSSRQDVLTPRETEVLSLLAKGISIARIGDILAISRHTAGDHVKSIYRKLNITSRAQAALEAQCRGLLS